MRHSRRFSSLNQLLHAIIILAIHSFFLVPHAAGSQSTISPQSVPIVTTPNMELLPDGKIVWKSQLANKLDLTSNYDSYLMFSSNGKSILIKQSRNFYRVLDAKTGRLSRIIRFTSKNDQEGVEFSPDLSLAAIARRNYVVEITDTNTRKVVRRIKVPVIKKYRDTYKNSFAGIEGFSANGRSLVTYCPDGYVRLWDVKSGRLICAVYTGNKQHKLLHITDMKFSDDGQILATREETGQGEQAYSIERFNFWNCKSGKMICQTEEMGCNTSILGFLKNNDEFTVAREIEAWGSSDRDIITFNIHTAQDIKTLEWRKSAGGIGLSTSLSCSRVYLALKTEDLDDYGDDKAYLLNLQIGQAVAAYPIGRGNVELAISPNGDQLAVLKKTGELEMWQSPILK